MSAGIKQADGSIKYYAGNINPAETSRLDGRIDGVMESLTHQANEGYLGKNLFNHYDAILHMSWDYYADTNRTIVNVEVEPSTTYTISRDNINGYVATRIFEKTSASATTQINEYSSIDAMTITTLANTHCLCFMFVKSSGEVTVSDIASNKIQVELGSSATTYVPFGYANTDLTKELNFAIDNGYISKNLLSSVGTLVPCILNVGDKVTFSASNLTVKNVVFTQFDENKTSVDYWTLNSATNPRVITIEKASSYIRLDSDGGATNIMLEKGTNHIPSNVELKESLANQAYSTSGLTYNNCSYLSGGYVKIGNLVVVNLRISSDGSSTFQINNLPSYTNKSPLNCVAVSIFDTADHNNQVFGYMASGGVLRAESVSGAHAHLISTVYLCD